MERILEFSGEKVRLLRMERNLTQCEVAQQMAATGKFRGGTRQRVHQIETGRHASAKTICALCEVFGVAPDFFFESQ